MKSNNKKDETREPISAVYDQIAESFGSKRSVPWTEVVDFINQLPEDFQKVLDLGCGSGRHTRVLLEKTYEVFASDISFKILNVAKKMQLSAVYPSLSGLINADGVELPFRLNSFDCIITIAVIHHLDTHQQRIAFLGEIYRTLKSKGLAFISCWLREHPRFKKDDLVEEVNQGEKDILVPWTLPNGKKIMRYYYLFEKEELLEMVKQVGFNINQCFISNNNLFLVLEK
jgi:alkylated DNA repair protein alkB family protein 8